jgi:hypothetical protein
MTLCDDVRRHCAAVAASARSVTIDASALERIEPVTELEIDPSHHYLDGSPEAVASYLLCLDAINFGSGWFPTLRRRPDGAGGMLSGYETVAAALAERYRSIGPWSNAELRTMSATQVAAALGQRSDHELMALYAQALRSLGIFLGERGALDVVAESAGSAERFAEALTAGMAMFCDPGFYKRAQLAASDLALAGVAEFHDLDRLTIFADNVLPHVLRCEGVLRYDPRLAAHIDAGRLLRPGPQERELRACAVHACELLSEHLGVAPRVLDNWLWTRGRRPEYKSRPRHRCRCVYY